MGMVLWGNLSWHPAAAAWRAVSRDARTPEAIEVLKKAEHAATYRLVGAGPGGVSIIARRSALAKARFARTVYAQILPRLPIRAPVYHGFKAESAEVAWLFLEDGASR
jgi:hypothetical protein